MACLRPRFFCCSPFSPCLQGEKGEQQKEQQGEQEQQKQMHLTFLWSRHARCF